MLFNLMKIYYESNADGGAGAGAGSDSSNNGNGGNQGDPENFTNFEDWYKALPEDHQKIVAPAKTHFEKMQATVKRTREERDTFQSQLRDAMKKTKEGSPEREQLEKLSNDLEMANQRANFYEEAPSHKCLFPKAAYALALKESLFDKKGNIDWKALEAEEPGLFGEAKPKLPKKGGAGSGTDEQPAKAANMNNWIRQAAGKNSITQQ